MAHPNYMTCAASARTVCAALTFAVNTHVAWMLVVRPTHLTCALVVQIPPTSVDTPQRAGFHMAPMKSLHGQAHQHTRCVSACACMLTLCMYVYALQYLLCILVCE